MSCSFFLIIPEIIIFERNKTDLLSGSLKVLEQTGSFLIMVWRKKFGHKIKLIHFLILSYTAGTLSITN